MGRPATTLFAGSVLGTRKSVRIRLHSLTRPLPTLIVATQLLWFHSIEPQPLVFDAGQYVALSQHWTWWGPFPTLPADGLRTYAYPCLISVAGSTTFLLCVQGIGLIVLMNLMRRHLLAPGSRVDIVLSILLLSFPILIPYALTVLADLPGVIALQSGLLAFCMAMFSDGVRRWGGFALAGVLISWSIQLRPAYAHIVWILLAAFLWVERESFSMIRPSRDSKAIRGTVAALMSFILSFVIVASPTLVVQLRENNRLSFLPGDETDRLLGYHLMLGLSLDRWSSNPPPLEERHHVELEWQKRGWAMLPVPPNPTPTIKDFKREVRRHPVHAVRQFIKHVYFAFSKFELFPYAGAPSRVGFVLLGMMNVLILALGTGEAIRRICSYQKGADRLFAVLQMALLFDLVVTCGLVVPEERFTLAIYPALMIFSAGAIVDLLSPISFSSVGRKLSCAMTPNSKHCS